MAVSNFTTDPSRLVFPTSAIGWRDDYPDTFHIERSGTIYHAQTHIEKFMMHEKVGMPDYLLYSRHHMEALVQDVFRVMEETFRKHVSYYGLLIPDSLQKVVVEYPDTGIGKEHVLLTVKARVICPTLETEVVDPDAPKRRLCNHCNTTSFEDAFHSGTCENCGAPYPKSEFTNVSNE